MKILVLNSGSSSVKFRLIRMEDESLLAKRSVEKIGLSDAIITCQPEGNNKIREIREILNHDDEYGLQIKKRRFYHHGRIYL